MNVRRSEVKELKAETVGTQWDFKKIAIGFVILATFFSLGALILFPKGKSASRDGALGVTSITDSEENSTDVPALPSKEDVKGIINEAQSTLSQITYENFTSSQAAIQKIINDLENLQEKKEPIDIIRELICKEK